MYAIHERIGPSKTDKDGVCRLVSALDIIQDCSLLWLESEPSFKTFLDRNGLGMFLVSRQADILRLPAYAENVTAETRVFECRTYFGYRNTVLYGEDGSPCILTWSIGAFIEMATGKMVRLPPEELLKVTLDQKIDMPYLDKKIAVPDLPGYRPGPVPVRRDAIDLYGHMNNVRYISAALDLLPDDKPAKRIRIEYKSPAKPGDLLYPLILEAPEDKRYILLLDALDKPYASIEFTY